MPTYYFFPVWDKHSDSKAFQAAAHLPEQRPGLNATLINWGNRLLTHVKEGSIKGVAYYVGEDNEFKHLKADYGKGYSLRISSVVLETGEKVAFGRFFEAR